MFAPSLQRETVARLTTYCPRLIERGQLPELDELNLRVFVNSTCNAFDMAPVPEQRASEQPAIRDAVRAA